RRVLIKPVEDQMPVVDVAVELLRKNQKGEYLVTPDALIPFSGSITDDHGLEKIEFVYNLTRVDSLADQFFESVTTLSALHIAAGGVMQSQGVCSVASLALLLKKNTPRPMEGFDEQLRRHPSSRVTLEQFRDYCQKPVQSLRDNPQTKDALELLRLFDMPQNPSYFQALVSGMDLTNLNLKASLAELQPKYKMRLWLDATDNDINGGPHVGHSKETFIFQIMSEGDLLLEIAKEEEIHYQKLKNVVDALSDSQDKLDKLIADLGGAPPKADAYGNMN